MDALTWVLAHWDLVLLAVTSTISAASVITAGTPTPDPSTRLGRLYRVVEILGVVVGKAKQTGIR